MSTYVVWLEMDVAKIFKIQVGHKDSRIIHRKEMKHHTSRDPKNHKDCEKFFHEVAESIEDANEVYLVGPGLAKEHFKDHLERHHHAGLATKVVGSETAHHLSDRELLDHSRKFFKIHDLYAE